MQHDAITLFCFSCSGSSAMRYLAWNTMSSGFFAIEPMELPGHGMRIGEPLLRVYSEAVEECATFIENKIKDDTAPFAFFGHSLGALLVYGCAHRLRSRGIRLPSFLAVACCGGPKAYNIEKFRKDWNDDLLIEALQNMAGTPQEIFDDAEMLRLTLDTLRADFTLCGEFMPPEDGCPLDMPILAIGGREDTITEESLSAWREETRAACEVHLFDGGHFFFQDNPRPLIECLIKGMK